ncbi:DNA-directed RNA polymerase III subunit RPC7-like [Poecilia latipinna]|uniref:DNA-directed RNA polymerase III subunit RPC7-like n=1 Tax=Poecilia latipinna TaxID=48699 RepID=UPI00072ED776|nr:PREDICTED: DNA-directed RNA polymerase III subunit RPC7-like [Poecilia latipinna]
MAGRGRGRRTLGLDPVVTSRGDSLPPAVQQPTPVFPVMEQKPLPLTGGEESEYLTALKQDFRAAMRSQPCFIQPAAAHRDVERYSDKYHLSDKMDGLTDWIIDWKRFPKELRVQIRKPRGGAALSHLAAAPLGQKKKKVGEKEEVLLKLETLEKKEQQESSEEEGEEQKEEEAEAEEEYDEEEFEEETDYIMSYFDNGEDFGGDSDDNMDEAVY